MDTKPFVIIAGVGAGTGSALAKRFAKEYPVALLARSTKFANALAAEIEADSGTAVSYQVDVSDEESVRSAFEQIREHFGNKCAAALFNASSRPFPKPFLWQSPSDLTYALDITLLGACYFAQAVMPLLLAAKGSVSHPPSLIFTGATASVKANAWMQPFAISKHALRALAMTLSREFRPQGLHIAHVIIDGVIRMPLTMWLKPFSGRDAKLDPAAIAENYMHLHTQPLAHMTAEVTLRPYCEPW